MPIERDNGQLLYRSHEAYEAIGRHYYGRSWTSCCMLGTMLPHRPEALRIVEAGGYNAERMLSRADPRDDNYENTQTRSKRTHETMDALQRALQWGKALAYRKVTPSIYTEINCFEWEGEGLFTRLKQEIRASINDGNVSQTVFYIDKIDFDKWVNVIPRPTTSLNEPLEDRKPPGRPGFDWQCFRDKLSEWEISGNLPTDKTGFRNAVCHDFAQWHREAFPDKKCPKVETIKKRLKPDLDRIAADYYAIG